MPNYNIVKLKNFTPTHIGTGKEHYDFSADELQSDTIATALAAIRAQDGNNEDIHDFLNSFSVSNAFPFYRDDLFLPKIHGKISATIKEKTEVEYRKRLKKVKYIDSELWGQLVKGEKLELSDNQIVGGFITKSIDFAAPYIERVTQRVTVPRKDNQDAKPFFFNWRFYRSESGLYCLIETQDETIFEEIKVLFKKLGEIGIGTDRNVGGGNFDVEFGTMELPDISNPTHTMLLSNYIPKREELQVIDLPNSIYSMSLRGGYISGSSHANFRHLRKRSIYVFNAGSIFPTTEKLLGEVSDLTPEWNDTTFHKVLRSGKPFYLPIKIVR